MKRLLFVLICLSLTLTGLYQAIAAESSITTTNTIQSDDPVLFFDGQAAYSYVALQLGFGHRPTGSAALEATREAMINILEANGWEVIVQPFQHEAQGRLYEGRNIIAKRGEGPITIIGSHYDSRIFADNDPDVNNHTEGVPGANDGASSTAVLLELSGVIDKNYTVDQQIWLVFFDAEDNGHIEGWDWIIGSTYMASHLDELGVTPNDIRFMLLLDMVGEAENQQFLVEANSLNSAPIEVIAIWQIAGSLGYAEHFLPVRRGPIIDDHLPFIQQGIPAVDIIDLNYPYWHTVDDTLDKVSAASLERVGRVVEMYLIQTDKLRLN